MKKILILTASFGDGHNAAARGLREAMESLDANAKVEVADLFASTYGVLNALMKQAYQGMVRYTPALWSRVFNVFDNPALMQRQVNSMDKMRHALRALFEKNAPDVVVSTYPVYGYLVEQLFDGEAHRPFRFITIVTDSISVCSAWYRAPSDLFVVANEPTAKVLLKAGVAAERIQALGFPVNPVFAQERPNKPASLPARPKVLYVINTGKARAGKSLEGLLKLKHIELTITVGRDASLKSKLTERLREYGERVRIFGWTNQMPQLLMSHDLVIGKAGGAMVQEAIAARCPMIVNQVIPGQEEGNARLIELLGVGAVAEKKTEATELVQEAFADQGRKWQQWRKNLEKVSRPDAALQIAALVLEQRGPAPEDKTPLKLFSASSTITSSSGGTHPVNSSSSRLLLCDFHIHTNYSDGRLTLPEIVDFYGRREFDCICITDHVVNPNRCKGRFRKLRDLSLAPAQLDEYFDMLERERRRAWRKYGMLVLAGLEFNVPGVKRKNSGHLLGLDLRAPIAPTFELAETVALIHAQGGLAVASRPHSESSSWGKNTGFLWDQSEILAPILDAWEIATRKEIFAPPLFKPAALLANSDFHKPKHIYSWKTVLRCELHSEAIKDCIRRNHDLAFVLYHDGLKTESLRQTWNHRPAGKLPPLMPELPALSARA